METSHHILVIGSLATFFCLFRIIIKIVEAAPHKSPLLLKDPLLLSVYKWVNYAAWILILSFLIAQIVE